MSLICDKQPDNDKQTFFKTLSEIQKSNDIITLGDFLNEIYPQYRWLRTDPTRDTHINILKAAFKKYLENSSYHTGKTLNKIRIEADIHVLFGKILKKILENGHTDTPNNDKLLYMTGVLSRIICVSNDDDILMNIINISDPDILTGIANESNENLNSRIKKFLSKEESEMFVKNIYIRSEIDLLDPNYKQIYGKESAIMDTFVTVKKKVFNLFNSAKEKNSGSFDNQLRSIAGIKFNYLEYYSLLATHVGIENTYILKSDNSDFNHISNLQNQLVFLKINRTSRQKLSDLDREYSRELFGKFKEVPDLDSESEEYTIVILLDFIFTKIPGFILSSFVSILKKIVINFTTVSGIVMTGAILFWINSLTAASALSILVYTPATGWVKKGILLFGYAAIPIIFNSIITFFRSLGKRISRDLSQPQMYMDTYFSSVSALDNPIIIQKPSTFTKLDININDLLKSFNDHNKFNSNIDWATDIFKSGWAGGISIRPTLIDTNERFAI